VLTDQNVRLQAGKGKRHHELLGMPESQDHPFILLKQSVQVVAALNPQLHRPAQTLNDLVAHGRGHRRFDEIRQALPEQRRGRGSGRLIHQGIAHDCGSGRLWNRIGELHGMQPLV
jgi:hypothetical protein